MVRPIEYAPLCPSLEEVAVCATQEVLIEVDDNILLIAQDLQDFFRPVACVHPIRIIINSIY